MKLYLSSYRIPSPDALLALSGDEAEDNHVAIIPNAKDYYAKRARNVKLSAAQDYLHTLGLSSDVVDLRDYRKSDMLEQKLKAYSMIWVVGGNTFCLRDEMKQSGFDSIITKLLNLGIVYIGESAGACVVGTSLKGLEGADEPNFAENVVWDGLNLIPSFILPHADNTNFSQSNDQARRAHADESIIELTDAQALIIDGDNQKIV